MRTNTLKKVFSVVLSFMMVSTMVPASAIAEVTTEGQQATKAKANDEPATSEENAQDKGSQGQPTATDPEGGNTPADAASPQNDNAPPVTNDQEASTQEEPADATQDGSTQGAPAKEGAPFDQSQTVDGVTVSVKAGAGTFPKDATLLVSKVAAEEREKVDEAVDAKRDEHENVAAAFTFNIKVLGADGKELQPEDGKRVDVSFALPQVADANLSTSVYHVEEKEDEDGLEAQKLNAKEDEKQKTVTANSDSFSYYTVEFTYDELVYVLAGNESVPLATILNAVGLKGDPQAATTSNSELFSVSKDSGEWVVTAHQAFDTKEWMKVTIANVEYMIEVTDSQGDVTLTAQADAIPYVDAQGNPRTPIEALKITKNTGTLKALFYYVEGSVNKSDIEVNGFSGQVNIILCDGAELHTDGISIADGKRLRIWTQSHGEQQGKLYTSEYGIRVEKGRSLEINGGYIRADTSEEPGRAGIGGQWGDAGTITINNGDIRAWGTAGGAGIGGGTGGSGGTITINGGTVFAAADKFSSNGGIGSSGAGIGGGGGANTTVGKGCGNITINGGEVEAYGNTSSAGIGCGWKGFKPRNGLEDNIITINDGVVKAVGGSRGAGIGSGQNGSESAGRITINGGEVIAIGNQYAAGIGGGDESGSGVITITDGKVAAFGTKYGAGIGSGDNSDNKYGAHNEITISGGSVYAAGGQNGAGIGGGEDSPQGGRITISGGDVIAAGGSGGAGIGGGYRGKCSMVIIDGGLVKAQGGDNGAGIGSGNNTKCVYPDGDVRISSGTVASQGGTYGAGIGSGNNGDAGLENIEISGGSVNAIGQVNAAGIGGGGNSGCGNINITGGSVEAAGQQRGAGIGGGSGRAAAYIGISNAQVYAVGEFGAGIGTGGSTLGKKNAGRVSGNQIVIKDSTVLAASLAGGAGIGGGIHGDGGNVKISGGAVAALGGTSHLNEDGNYETYGIEQFKDYINTDKCSHVVKQVVETIGVKGLRESGQQGQQGQQGTQPLQSQSTENPNRLVAQAIWDDAWDWISDAASDVWGGIKDAWGFLKDVTTWPFEHFDDAVDAIKDVVKWPYDHLDTIIDTINWPYYKVKSLFGEGSSFEEIYYTGAGIGGGYKGVGSTITIEGNALVDAQAGRCRRDGTDGSVSSSIGMGKLGSAPTSVLSTDVSIYQSAKVTYGTLDPARTDDANQSDRYHRDEDEAMYTSGRDPNVDYDVMAYQYAVIEPGEIRLKVEKQWKPDNTTPAYPLLINHGVDYYAGDGSANKFVYGDFYLNEGSDWTGFVDVSSPPHLWLKETPLTNPTNNGVSWKTSWKLVYPKAGPQGGNPAEGIVDATVDAKDQKAWFDLREKPQGMSDEDYVAVKKSVVDGTAKIVLTNTRMKTYHVTKKWQGSDTNPSSIATVLQKKEVNAEGNETWKTVETITLPKDGKWEADFKPVEDLGDENYRVRELDPTSTDQNEKIVYDRSDNATQSGALKNTFTWENGGNRVDYDVSYVRENNKTTITNDAKKDTIQVQKNWDIDLEQKDHPNSIEVVVQKKNGDNWEPVKVVELNDSNKWKADTGLPKTQDGNKITYRVRELREETVLQTFMSKISEPVLASQDAYNQWLTSLKGETEYWSQLPDYIKNTIDQNYDTLVSQLGATGNDLFDKLKEKLHLATVSSRIVYDKGDSDKSGDANVVIYNVDTYMSTLEGQVNAHKTKYKVSYDEKNGKFSIKNKAILDIDTIKRWMTLGDADKPGHAWVVLMCKPKADAKDKAGNLAGAAGVDLGGVLDYEFPVIDPLEGGMDPISAISKMALGIDLGIFDSILGDIIDIPDIAIAKVSEDNNWTKRFVVEKYAKGIPMEFKGAEATSEILKQVIKYFTGVDLPISFSLSGYFSIPTKAVSTPLGMTDLDLSKLAGNALAKAQSLTMQDLESFGANTLLDDTHLMANVINVKIDWDDDSDSEPTVIKGTKTWADKKEESKDKDGNTVPGYDHSSDRPNTLKIHIKGKDNKDVTGSPIELKKSDWQGKDTWNWEFTLPEGVKKKDCTVSEEYPQDYEHKDDYLLSVDGFNLTNTWREDIIYGQKTWKDGNNQDGKRPETITVHLYAQVGDGPKQEVQVKDQLSNDDSTSGSGEQGSGGGSGSDTGSGSGGQESGTTNGITVSEKNGWRWFFKAPRVDKEGKEITYTIEEDAVEGYTPEYDGLNITNTYETEKTEVKVNKVWNHGENSGNHPESVEVELYANGKETNKTLTLNESNQWQGTFEDLDKKQNGQDIAYTVSEEPVEDYRTEIQGDAANGFTITNTYDVTMTHIAVNKVWVDGNDQDGIRPQSVTVKLLKGGTETDQQLTLSADNEWSDTFYNVKVQENDQYSVKEVETDVITDSDSGPGKYSSSVSGSVSEGFTVTNTHTPETITLNGQKTWEDNNNQDNKRPSQITVRLLANDEEVEGQSKTVTSTNDWKWSFENQPKYKDGKEISYTVAEDAVEGYTSEANGLNVTNTHEPEKMDIVVRKTWEDSGNQDGKRPESVTVNLLKPTAGGGTETIESKTVTADTDWTCTFQNKDRYAGGQEITYSVTEGEVPNYQAPEISGDADKGFSIINKHTPETTTVSGSKTWNGDGESETMRPESITIRLRANGEEVAGQSKTVTANDQWKWEFTNLPKYKDGQEIVYTVTEDAVDNYTTQVNGANVTNTYNPNTTQVSVSKTWDDGNNADGIRPQSVTVKLVKKNTNTNVTTTTDQQLTLFAGNNWSGTFSGLAPLGEGEEYSVEEAHDNVITGIDGPETYADTVTTNAKQSFTITNKHTPKTTSLTIHKVWDDDNDRDGKRPTYMSLDIMANGEYYDTQTIEAKNDWTLTINNLPTKKNGVPVTYSVEEVNAAEYQRTVTSTTTTDVGTSITLTNKHTPETTTVAGKKTWNDKNNMDSTRPESVVIRLYANGKETRSKRVTAEDDWSWKFKDLYKNEDGKEIVYTISEDAVENYTSEVNGFDVVNTYAPGKTSINVSKIWNDDNDRDGIRPKAVTVRLLANGQSTNKALRLSDVDGWTGSFTRLDARNDDGPITYTVSEDEIAGYTSSVNGDVTRGFIINNTHGPETVRVPIYKVWDDSYNQGSTRPSSVEVYLYANGQKVAGKTLTSQNFWQCVFEKGNDGVALPKYEDGKEIVYTVSEEPVNNYSATVKGNAQKGFTITNTLTPNKTSLSVRKIWKDDYNRDGKRPDSITVHLLNNNVDTGKTLVLDESNSWSGTFTELAQGDNVQYSVQEDSVEEYTPLISPESPSEGFKEGFTIRNEHSTEITSVTGEKVWVGDKDAIGARPASITVRLYANGREVDSKNVDNTFDANPDKWTWGFFNLPKYENGKEIAYSVSEDAVPGYATTYETQPDPDNVGRKEHIITNTYNGNETQILVHQVWADNNNQDGLRPATTTVQLYANGKPTDKSVVLGKPTGGQPATGADADDTLWYGTFKKLDVKDANGNDIQYTVSEAPIDDYQTYYYGYAKRGYTIVSEHEPDTVTVSGTKVWEDQGNLDGSRPVSVTVRLTAKDKETNEVKLKKTTEVAGSNNTNTWDWSFAGLPKKIDGKEVEYSVDEDPVAGYSHEITGDATGGYTITNTHVPNTTSVAGTKVWDDSNDQDGKRPDHATIILYANGSMTAQTEATETSDGTWRWAFNNLPQTNAGDPITYTIGEEQVKGYEEPVITGDATNGYVVTNKRVPEKITISGSKVWDDNNNAEGMRPSEITVRLMKNDGQIEVASKKVTATDDWKWSFTDLPSSESGEIIDYNIVEDPVKGYEATITGALTKGVTITNSPEKVRISGTKVWNDNNNQEGKRPSQITVHLMKGEGANQKEVEKKTVTEEDNWDWEFADQLKYEAGKEVAYTVTEDAVEGYESAVTGDVATGFTVTNTLGSSVPNPNAQKFSITYKLNGGTYEGSTDDIVETYEVGTVISVHEAPTREGYTFDYWKGSKYQPGDEYTVKEDHTFEAQWKENGGTPDDGTSGTPDDGTSSDASGNNASQGGSGTDTRTATAKTADASASPLAFAAIGLAVLAIARRRRRE